MDIISQFIENLNNLAKNIFLVTTNLEPLNIKDDVSSSLSSLISNPEINDLISSINISIHSLNELISPIASIAEKEIKKKHYPIEQTPYASFIIDEPPIIKENPNNPVQLSF